MESYGNESHTSKFGGNFSAHHQTHFPPRGCQCGGAQKKRPNRYLGGWFVNFTHIIHPQPRKSFNTPFCELLNGVRCRGFIQLFITTETHTEPIFVHQRFSPVRWKTFCFFSLQILPKGPSMFTSEPRLKTISSDAISSKYPTRFSLSAYSQYPSYKRNVFHTPTNTVQIKQN